jgi:hypothetical protein
MNTYISASQKLFTLFFAKISNLKFNQEIWY